MTPLPAEYVHLLERLAASAWRERKEAASGLRERIAGGGISQAALAELGERLLDGLVSPDALNGRAACHEVLVAIGPACTPAVARRLGVPGPGVRLLVDLLGEIGGPAQVGLLRAILDDAAADANLRASAATALGRIGGDEVGTVLRRLLADPSEMLRMHALDALRVARTRVPVGELEPVCSTKFTRKAGAALLGFTQDEAAIPMLRALLDDAMSGVRAVAATALAALDDDLGERGAVESAVQDLAGVTLERLRDLVEHPDRDVRSSAIRILAMAGDAEAIPVVLRVMDDPLLAERAIAMVTTLGAKASDALVLALEEAGPSVRDHGLRLIGALDPASLRPELRHWLHESLADLDEDVAVAAAEALASVGTADSLSPLYRAMEHESRAGESAANALAAVLGRLEGEASATLARLVGGQWPEEGALACNLCQVAAALGSARFAPALVSLLGSVDVGVRVAAARAVGQLPGDHEGQSALIFALADEEPRVRATACRSLGNLEAAAAAQPLLSVTHDASPMVRSAAVAALVVLDNPVSLARLRAIVAEDPVPSVVVQAVAGLGRSGLDQDLTMLMSLCTSAEWDVVKAASRALRHFSAHRATAALLGLLGHERWDVRWTAAEVLGARADPTAAASLRAALRNEQDGLVCGVLQEALGRLERES